MSGDKAHVAVVSTRRTDHGQRAHVITHARVTDELRRCGVLSHERNRQAVGTRFERDVIEGNQPSRAGHVLDDDGGLAWQVPGDVTGDQPRIDVVATAGTGRHNDPHGAATKAVGGVHALRGCARRPGHGDARGDEAGARVPASGSVIGQCVSIIHGC